ncbi:MAG TPA: hypothetical protein VLB50_02915, partial [Ignavibacteriaceae bacterium]|nr:hypothetical protein [Ignavibacteriaceae bacterium]
MEKNLKYVNVPQISSVRDMLYKSAKQHPDKIALEDLSNTPIGNVTFSQLLQNVLKFGSSLKKLGLPERAHL